EQDKPFKIGVAVIQQSHGIFVGAGMKRLSDYETFDLTRGCLVRSQDRKIKQKWDAYNILNQMVEAQGGEWVDLNEEDLKFLINIYSVFQEKSNYRLSEEEVLEFSKELTKNNSLLLEILSKPSGHIELDDDDYGDLVNDLTKTDDPNSKPDDPNIENDDDLSELFGTEANNKTLTPPINDENDTDDNPSSSKADYKRKNITGFTFQGSKYEVRYWRELLITVCNLMKSNHENEFEKVLTLKGRKRSLFSNDPSQLMQAEQIQGTNIYVEIIQANSGQIMKNVKKIIALFGYPEDSISFEIKEDN
ncbi:MAG: hypothetical protein ACKPH7_14120, partial [Planktothrix sp.]